MTLQLDQNHTPKHMHLKINGIHGLHFSTRIMHKCAMALAPSIPEKGDCPTNLHIGSASHATVEFLIIMAQHTGSSLEKCPWVLKHNQQLWPGRNCMH